MSTTTAKTRSAKPKTTQCWVCSRQCLPRKKRKRFKLKLF